MGAGRRGFSATLRMSVQFKTYRLCISGLFHQTIFRLRVGFRVTQPTESKTSELDLHTEKYVGFFFF